MTAVTLLDRLVATSGFATPRDELRVFMRWTYYANPQAYAIRLALAFAFCNRNDDGADTILTYYDIQESEMFQNFAIMVAIVIFFFIV